jgi:phosphoglycolate phosphatase
MRNLLFDLDGTLTDPGEGITACFRYALDRLGRPSPPAEELARYIGPPIRLAFSEILRSDDARLIEEAVSIYRERFTSVGLYENRLYDGVPEMLANLRSAGFRLFVATSKPQVYAEKVLCHFSLDSYFDDVQGNELGGRLDDKADLVRELMMRHLLRADSTVMIGDRRYDVRAAVLNGLQSVGVTYGYGTEAELRNSGVNHVIGCPNGVEVLIKTL